nr:MAG TPA: hypothetical protein [Caudoviricetes sp.]
MSLTFSSYVSFAINFLASCSFISGSFLHLVLRLFLVDDI